MTRDTPKLVTGAALLAIVCVSISLMWIDALWPAVLAELSVFVLTLGWCIYLLVWRLPPRGSFVLIPLTGAVLWIGLQIIAGTTRYQWRTELTLLYWLCAAGLTFTGLQFFSADAWRTWFLRALVWLAFAVCAVSLGQYLAGNEKIYGIFETKYDTSFLFGPFVYHSQFAAFIELVLPIALFGALRGRQGSSVCALVAAISYACIVATASRGGFILTTVEMLVVPLLMRGKQLISARRAASWALVTLTMAAGLVAAAGPARLLARFAKTDPIRVDFTRSSIEMLGDHPWTGVGLGNWATIYPAYAHFDDGLHANQAHNDWVQWAAEGGLPFLAMMLWMAAWSVRRGIRSIWGIGVPVVFLHCLIDYPIQRIGVALVFFLMIASLEGHSHPTDDPSPAGRA